MKKIFLVGGFRTCASGEGSKATCKGAEKQLSWVRMKVYDSLKQIPLMSGGPVCPDVAKFCYLGESFLFGERY